MTTDSPYTYGPGTPFRVNDVFTNRDEYINEYHQRVLVHCTRTWSTEQIFDHERPARNVLSFFGEGGIGKSALIRRIANQSIDGTIPGLPDHRAVAVIDFADPSSNSFESTLFRIRASFGKLARSWPAFDFTFSLYWERKHPGEALAAFARRESWVGKVANGANVSEQIVSTVDDLVGSHGAVGFGYRLANRIGHFTTQAVKLRQLRRDLPAFDLLVQEPDPDRMLNQLPGMLAYDIEGHRKRRSTFALCLLDTFENVQALPPIQGALEDMMARLVYMLPNVYFLVASRQPLQWHDPVRSVGLTFGGARRWPGLAGIETQRDQFPIDGLRPQDADAYLRRRLTAGDLPAIPDSIRQEIVDAAGGSPLYLELSASLFEEITSHGGQPSVESFGRSFPELTIRMMRDLNPEDRQILRAASLLEAFDVDLLRLALPDVPQRRIERLLHRRFIHYEPAVWPPYRLHENLRKSIGATDELVPDGWTVDERTTCLLRVIAYLESIVLSIWSNQQTPEFPLQDHSQKIVASFLLVLHAAAEYNLTPPRLGFMAYTLRQLGYGQVLTSLPDYPGDRPELARLATVARLCSDQSLDVAERYNRMKAAAGDLTSGSYAGYACLELGFLAWWVDMDAAENYFLSAYGKPPDLNNSTMIGLANTALRRSRYNDVLTRLHDRPSSRMDQLRTQDILGHSYLHNGSFEQAAEIFATNLDRAQAVGVPLFIARSARHLALAYMWFDAERARAAIREAWDINEAIDSGVGIAQCDLAAALASAMDSDWYTAEGRYADAQRRYQKLGVKFELMPPDPVQILIQLGQGHTHQALVVGERIASAQLSGTPVGPPVWTAVAALWLDRPDWYNFDDVDWIEQAGAQERWLAPVLRLTSHG